MRRIIITISLALMIVPIIVSAETFTYNVCKNDCEYNELNDVFSLLEDKSMNEGFSESDDIIININDSGEYTLNRSPKFGNSNDFYAINYNITANSYNTDNRVYLNSFVIKSNYEPKINAESIWVLSDKVILKNINFNGTKLNGGVNIQEFNNIKGLETDVGKIKTTIETCEDIRIIPAYEDIVEIYINNSKDVTLFPLGNGANATILNTDGVNINGAGTFHIEKSKGITFGFALGNADIQDSQFDSFMSMGVNMEIYNSTVAKIINYAAFGDSVINIYNSKIVGDKYYKLYSEEEMNNLTDDSFSFDDAQTWPWDYLDLSAGNEANTYFHFDKIKVIKQGEKINLLEEFEYLNKNKEISYSIDNQAIAKVSDNKLTALTPGTTKVTATTDDGHFIYTLNLTVEPVNSGIVEKKETETKNYAEADFSSNDLNSIIPLTNEEQTLKESGKNIEVFLEVKDASKTVAKDEKKIIEEKLSSNEEIGTYLDVSLFKQVEGEEASKIEKTNGNIRVSLNVPEDLINKDNKIKRTYYILRLHDGVVDKLDTNFDGKVLTFETDRFSTYALTYKDEVISNINNPKTGDNIIKYMGILFGSIMLVVFMLIEKINIKNKN